MPESAISSAAWMPATPPPMTRARLVIGAVLDCSSCWRRTRSMPMSTRSIALSVAISLSSWIHEHCSRMFTMSIRYGFRPPSATARRNVGSCMRGEHEAMTTRVRPFSWMAFLIASCPGCEQE